MNVRAWSWVARASPQLLSCQSRPTPAQPPRTLLQWKVLIPSVAAVFHQGMEYTDAEPSAAKQRLSSSTSNAPMVPLAQLLSETSVVESVPSALSLVGSTAEEEHLRAELAGTRKKLDHFNEVG